MKALLPTRAPRMSALRGRVARTLPSSVSEFSAKAELRKVGIGETRSITVDQPIEIGQGCMAENQLPEFRSCLAKHELLLLSSSHFFLGLDDGHGGE